MQEQSRKEKEAERKREALIKEYSLQCNSFDEEPPFPGMELNAWRSRWEPVNVEEFIRLHGEDFNKLKNAGMNNLESTSASKVSVQREHQCTDTTATTETKASQMPTPSVKSERKPKCVSEPPTPAASSDVTTSNKTEQSACKDIVAVVEQSRNTRVSSKMVNADFDELTREFLHTVSLGEKKPVFLPLELRKALETLARLSGVPNLAPSHIVINILREFFDEHRDLINRKLSGVKLSV